MRCVICVGNLLVRRHNALNYGISRVLHEYKIPYTMEPKGMPLGSTPKKGFNNYKMQNGPDGIATLYDRRIAVELHVTMPVSFHNATSKISGYCSVTDARHDKEAKYKGFKEKYDVDLTILSASVLGALHTDSWKDLKENWIPSMEEHQGFLFALRREIKRSSKRFRKQFSKQFSKQF